MSAPSSSWPLTGGPHDQVGRAEDASHDPASGSAGSHPRTCTSAPFTSCSGRHRGIAIHEDGHQSGC